LSTIAQSLSDLPATIDRRFYPRIVPFAPVYITFDDANACLLMNVSENGLLLSTPTELLCNYVARIALSLNGLPKPVQVNVRVVWASETRKLAGIQLLDLSDHDREQIRKWGAYASTPSLHHEVQREPQRETNQLRVVSSPFPMRSEKPEPAPTAKTPLHNPPAVTPSTSGLPAQFTSPFTPLAQWAVPLAVVALVGIFLYKSGAMEHSFGRSTATIPNATAIAPPPTPDSEPSLQTSGNTKGIVGSEITPVSPGENDVKPRSAFSPTPTLPHSTEWAEPRHETERTLDPQLVPPQNPRQASRPETSSPSAPSALHNSTTESQAFAPTISEPITSSDATNLSAPPRVSSATPSFIPFLPTGNEPTSDLTRPSNGAPKAAKTLSTESGVALASPVAPRDSGTPVAQPVIEMDAPARQILEIHLPSDYRAPFINVPGERVLETSTATMRIQRSVRVPAAHSGRPFHRKTDVVVGGLISRVEPAVVPVRSGFSAFVRVSATVAQDGRVESVRPVAGPADLMPAVLKAVREWRYQPTLMNGKPVETQADVAVQFHVPPPRNARP
jgi:hypothetical protein